MCIRDRDQGHPLLPAQLIPDHLNDGKNRAEEESVKHRPDDPRGRQIETHQRHQFDVAAAQLSPAEKISDEKDQPHHCGADSCQNQAFQRSLRAAQQGDAGQSQENAAHPEQQAVGDDFLPQVDYR